MSTTLPTTSMVENCKKRRSLAYGYAAQFFDNPPAEWREDSAIREALPHIEHVTWLYILQIIKKFIAYKFAVPGDTIKINDLPRRNDAIFQKFIHLNVDRLPEIAENYCDYVVDKVVELVNLEEQNCHAVVAAVTTPPPTSAEDEINNARRKNATKEAQTFKDNLASIHKQIKKYDNNDTTKYPFHQHLRDFNNKVDYFKITSASGFVLLNSIAENQVYLTDALLRTYFDQTLEHVTRENLKNSLITQNYVFTNFASYIENLEALFNSESQTVNYVTTQLRNDFIHKGDLEAAKLVNRFDEVIIRNLSLPTAHQLSSIQIKTYFMNAIQRGQNPHNAGMSVHLQKMVGSSNDWSLIKEKFSDLVTMDASLYHSECPENSPCRSDDVIDLDSTTTRSYSNKNSKKNVAADSNNSNNITPLGFNMETFNSFMQAQTKLANDMSLKLAAIGGHNQRKQLTASAGPNNDWQNMNSADFMKLKADAEAKEGCALGSKGPWIKGTHPECSKCKAANYSCEHHDSSCYYTYPWLRKDNRQSSNNRGFTQNYHRGGRNNGPYNRRGGRNGK